MKDVIHGDSDTVYYSLQVSWFYRFYVSCCSVPQLNTEGQPICAPTPVHLRVQVHCMGREDCVCDRFQLPRHVGSRTPSSEGDSISLIMEVRRLCNIILFVCWQWLCTEIRANAAGLCLLKSDDTRFLVFIECRFLQTLEYIHI